MTDNTACDIKNPGLTAQGHARIDWALQEMPVLRGTAHRVVSSVGRRLEAKGYQAQRCAVGR